MLAIPPFWASSKNALLRANTKPPVELVVADLDICGQHRFSWTMSVCIAEWEGRKNEQKRSENIL